MNDCVFETMSWREVRGHFLAAVGLLVPLLESRATNPEFMPIHGTVAALEGIVEGEAVGRLARASSRLIKVLEEIDAEWPPVAATPDAYSTEGQP